MSKNIPTICFIGLPSAGKSSIINSLIGKHILKTGVYRTTKTIHFIGKENAWNLPEEQYRKKLIISDDGWEFNIVDLPGVADSENVNSEINFNQLTNECILKCDIIFWVSDIRTAFMTTYEKQEFEKVQTILSDETNASAKLYDLKIMLSKYEFDDEDENESDQEAYVSDDELSDKEEDTTLADGYARIVSMFPKIDIVKFNAFGRIYHRDDVSANLKKFIKASSNISDKNIEFNIEYECKDRHSTQQHLYFDKFKELIDSKNVNPTNEDVVIKLLIQIKDREYLTQIFILIMCGNLSIQSLSKMPLKQYYKFGKNSSYPNFNVKDWVSLDKIEKNQPDYMKLAYLYDSVVMSICEVEETDYIYDKSVHGINEGHRTANELHVFSIRCFMMHLIKHNMTFHSNMETIKVWHDGKSILYKKILLLSEYIKQINTIETIGKKWRSEVMELRSNVWGNQSHVDLNELLFHVRAGNINNIFSVI